MEEDKKTGAEIEGFMKAEMQEAVSEMLAPPQCAVEFNREVKIDGGIIERLIRSDADSEQIWEALLRGAPVDNKQQQQLSFRIAMARIIEEQTRSFMEDYMLLNLFYFRAKDSKKNYVPISLFEKIKEFSQPSNDVMNSLHPSVRAFVKRNVREKALQRLRPIRKTKAPESEGKTRGTVEVGYIERPIPEVAITSESFPSTAVRCVLPLFRSIVETQVARVGNLSYELSENQPRPRANKKKGGRFFK